MSETEKPFTVSDRRHFAPDGRPRAADDEGADPAAANANRPRDEAPDSSPRPATVTPTVADFSQFLLSLGAQAGVLLSGEGEGPRRAEGLEAAQSIIAILEMLKDKTEGRRSGSEDTLLDDLLFQLRMAYVEAARGEGV
jgi:hypothetical protein